MNSAVPIGEQIDSIIPGLGTTWPLVLPMLGILVVLALARRVPVLRTVVSAISWVLLVGVLLMVLSQRSRFDPYFASIASRLGLEAQQVVGDEVRIRMASDGHFWVRARLNGFERRMLVDSGATVTAISEDTARRAGIAVRSEAFPVLIQTANGPVRAQTGRVDTLRIGNVRANGVEVIVSPSLGGFDVIGMNFLSKLKSWRVEGRTLILVPHNPQPGAV